jgi:hypothetical protein
VRICKIYYGGRLKQIDPGLVEIQSNGRKHLYLFREEKENEGGKIPRVHNDHPLIKNILSGASEILTNPIPTIGISLKNLGKVHEKFKSGHEGLIFVFKLVVSAIEDDEVLAPLAFVKVGDQYKPLDVETSKILAEAENEVLGKQLSKSPIGSKELYGHWEKWKKDILAKYEVRNEKLYSREMDRIHRFWDNHALRTKDNIDRIKTEISQLRRRRDNSLDFNEKRELDQKIQKAELKLNQMNINLIKEEQEALVQKQKEVDVLNEKLQMNIEDKLIAVATVVIQ